MSFPAQVVIDRPVGEVFSTLVDLARLQLWLPEVDYVRVTRRRGSSFGAAFELTVAAHGQFECEVTDCDLNRDFVVLGRGLGDNPDEFGLRFTLEAQGAGTRVSAVVWGSLGLFEWLDRSFGPHQAWPGHGALSRLKELVEPVPSYA